MTNQDSSRALGALAAAFVALGAGAAHADITGSASLTGAEPTMSPRFFRSGTPGGVCAPFAAGNFNYLAVPMTADASGTVTATFDPQTCGTGVFVTFHEGPFNPASICDGHVWSFGSSQAYAGETFAVTPNASLTMVVSGVANAPVACGPFTYTIERANPTSTVPTLGEWAMFGLTALLAGAGFWIARRRFRLQAI